VSEITLEVGGNRLEGWKRVSIERELGAICGRFSLGMVDSWNAASQSWFVKPYSACRVLIDRDPVLTGYVDQLEVSRSSSGLEISAAGRDKTADLVDCSAILNAYELKNVTLSQLVRKLIADFGIKYVEQASPGKPFPFVQISCGTRVAQILEDHAKYRGVLFQTDEAGQLVLALPGAKRAATAIISGQNLKQYTIRYDTQDRFSKYVVQSQTAGSAEDFGASSNQIQGQATDSGVPRYRPYGIVADQSATADDSKKRAQWEAISRAARTVRVSVEVVGWRQGPDEKSPLWEVNAKVQVKIPEAGLDGEFLIAGLHFSRDLGGGSTTTIELERPDAYLPEPLVDPETKVFGAFAPDAEDE